MVLCSRVEGIVTRNGEPVQGAEIIQETFYRKPGDVPDVTVLTDSEGRFVLEELSQVAGFSRFIPGEVRIMQLIRIRIDNEEYVAWRHSKSSGDKNSELDGKPIKLTCELTTAADFEGTHYGICRVAEE